MFLVLGAAQLLRSVPALEFRYNLLMCGLSASSFEVFYLAYIQGQTCSKWFTFLGATVPFDFSFSEFFVAWRDLNDF
jgi:hypothetical protein